MNKIRVLILIGQLGRIFAKSFVKRQYFSALVAVGFYMLFVKKEQERELNADKFLRMYNENIEEDELY